MWIVLAIVNGLVALSGAGYALIALAYLDAPYRGGWREGAIAVALLGLLALGPIIAFILARRADRRLFAFAWVITAVAAQIIIERVSGHSP